MRIAEAARATGTTPRALRWYEEHGLLDPSRTAAGYRDYGEPELRRITTITILQATGFTLGDLAAFTELLDRPVPETLTDRPVTPRCATAIAVTRARLATLDRHLADVAALRDRLAGLLDGAGTV
ncbi:MerR family transcriptional regulator [Pseudonocardia endophytica]|uniref:DNA-binding transcriptional MerR regulator n=1 Tax=Pseudonocardia endophytica TaxID=401976 RepID=A0A4V2PHU8_PSEEN|nr:MerR family transcriptional regulator [Pseudonocardia endophytica]TCK22156.1 DNA-binding transcriptional MerR regulator [Pseudonocardia endophytica]